MENNPYDLEFYQKSIRPDRQHSYKEIARYLYETYKPKSVMDFGCGCGWLLYYLKEFGISTVIGFERSEVARTLQSNKQVRDEIVFGDSADLTDKNLYKHIWRLYDMAICIEVAEHIEDKYSEILVNNITQNTDLLVFSAAPPGQGGIDHVNERTWTYWKNRFAKVGFEKWDQETETMRHYLKAVNVKSWYANNMCILRRK